MFRELDRFFTMIRAFLLTASASCVDREGNFCAGLECSLKARLGHLGHRETLMRCL
jgi:hypothetical protein